MRFIHRISAAAALLAIPAGACSQAGMQPVSMIDADQEKTVDGEKRPEMQARADLPFAQGKTFVSLDDYLAFLKKRGATDVPWYREVAPGVYELVGRRGPGAAAHTYTRAQLMERFGFDR